MPTKETRVRVTLQLPDPHNHYVQYNSFLDNECIFLLHSREHKRTFIHYRDKDVKPDNDVRDRILEEAIRLFLKNGFKGTSVKDLTEAVGIARGTLYCHFKSKDEVLESILEKYSREHLDQLIATIDDCKADFVTKFRTFFRFTTEFARDNRELLLAYNTLIGEIIGNNSDAEKKIRELQAKFNFFVENLITYGQGEGTVPKEIDAHTHSHVITATFSGMLLQWYVNKDSLRDDKQYARSFRVSMLRVLGVADTPIKKEGRTGPSRGETARGRR